MTIRHLLGVAIGGAPALNSPQAWVQHRSLRTRTMVRSHVDSDHQ